MDKVRALAVCGFGVGTSMLLKIKLTAAFRELGVLADVQTADVSSAASTPCDVIFTSAGLEKNLASARVPVIAVNKFTDREEILKKVGEYLESKKAQ